MLTIVNPVNTVGVMGKGLAKTFRERYPEIYEPYRQACHNRTFCTSQRSDIDAPILRPSYISISHK